MLTAHNLTYSHPNKDILFENIHFSINRHDKVALVGNNGIGKSTLLSILAGRLVPSGGTIVGLERAPYYIPQIFGQYNDYTVAEALGVQHILHALYEILGGNATEDYLSLLEDDDWFIEERCRTALAHWQLNGVELTQKMGTLSGGEKTKVFLAGMMLHKPKVALLDEPSNHLDSRSRRILYDYVQATTDTLVVVSHDRKLLTLVDSVYEMSKRGITVYGGNYELYQELKTIENNAINENIHSARTALKKAKLTEKETLERKLKLDARGRKRKEKEGLPKIMLNTLKNNAERSTARIRDVHSEKIDALACELQELKGELPDLGRMKFGLDNSTLHKGKILIEGNAINHCYHQTPLWKEPIDIVISSGDRIAIRGANGSGKTTLLNIVTGHCTPHYGTISRAAIKSVFIDQDYSLIDNGLTVYEQAQHLNTSALEEHEVKIRLSRFLFTKDYWDKPCSTLSGGEKMRLILCCLTISTMAPDMIILDEPTNNLDMQNIAILTAAINDYRGTVLVVSHDEYFVEELQVQRVISLE